MANDDTAAKVFWKPYENQTLNFMTPHVMGYYFITDGAVELSKGRSILSDKKTIWGVTVTRHEKRDNPASMCFDKESDALEYIVELGGEL